MYLVSVSNFVLLLLYTFLVRKAGAFLQLIIGLIGMSCLCIFIVAWRFGAVGFMFMYFHLLSFGIILLQCVIMFYSLLVDLCGFIIK
jgi:hypothetical protein